VAFSSRYGFEQDNGVRPKAPVMRQLVIHRPGFRMFP
jgi:hypothetical protein